MPDMPETARLLLEALVEIENQAIAVAREGGCKCSDPAPGTDRNYPYARFDYANSVGKVFEQIEWELIHQPGCPMDGQKGVGYASSPEHS